MENLVKINRICELLDVTRPTIYKWIKGEGFPVIRIKPLGRDVRVMRFRKSDVMEWFEGFSNNEENNDKD